MAVDAAGGGLGEGGLDGAPGAGGIRGLFTGEVEAGAIRAAGEGGRAAGQGLRAFADAECEVAECEKGRLADERVGLAELVQQSA